MKQILLSLLCSLFLSVGLLAQSDLGSNCYNCATAYSDLPLFASADLELTVYPNPATDFIMLKNAEGVKAIKIFNLTGRQVKYFDSIIKGASYPVADLPNGMYLVQLLDLEGDVITTHRMNKRQ